MGGDPTFYISVSRDVLKKVMDHVKSTSDVEVVGVLTGRMEDYVLIIEDAVTGVIESEAAGAVMPSKTIAKIADDIINKRIKGNVVGWYHSHPGFGLFMSDIDIHTQAKLQQFSPYITALVVDPTTDEASFFTMDTQTKRPIPIPEDYVHIFNPGEEAVPPEFRAHPSAIIPEIPVIPGIEIPHRLPHRKPPEKPPPKPPSSRQGFFLGIIAALCIGLVVTSSLAIMFSTMLAADNTPPTIKHAPPSHTVFFGQDLKIAANITDDSEIGNVTLTYNIGYIDKGWINKTIPPSVSKKTFCIANWTIPHIEGNISYYITATDTNNNIARSSVYTIAVVHAHRVIIIAPTTRSRIYTQTPTTIDVSYNYTDLHPKKATIKIYNTTSTIDETTISPLEAGTNITRKDSLHPLSATDGAYDVSVTVYDMAGYSTTDTQTNAIIIDNTPPVVNITYPADGGYVDTVPIIWINGTVTEINIESNLPMINDTEAFNFRHFNAISGEFAFYNKTVIPDCTHSYTVNFTDLAGNTGYDMATFTIDTIYPIVGITYPTNNHYFDSESVYWINGTFVEKNLDRTAPLVIDKASETTSFTLADWTWNSTTYEGTFAFCNNTVIADGSYFVMVTLTDMAGKSTSDIVHFYIDTVNPIVTITFPEDDYHFSSEAVIWINGTFTEKNFDISGLYINGTFERVTHTWDSTSYEGTFVFKKTSALENGTYHIMVSITDMAGKTGNATVKFEVGLLTGMFAFKNNNAVEDGMNRVSHWSKSLSLSLSKRCMNRAPK